MTEKLKPCPFCGGTSQEISQLSEYTYHDTWIVKCSGCSAKLSICHYAKDITYYKGDIIKAWNRRPPIRVEFYTRRPKQ